MLTASRGGAAMSLTYDKAGRKLTMDDPDMGDWSYVYNALGSMTSQTDARGCTLTIGYDVLNRPTSKASSGAGCGTQVNTSYTYDAGTNGKGRRTSMSITGADFTQWTYDSRGRVMSEAKQITGGGQFVTAFTYNSADLPVTMTYPDDEIVNFAYNNNMLPTSVSGTDTYAQSIAYDSANRMIQMIRGANKVNSVYTYNAWNQDGGRLQNLTSTRVADGSSLQNLTYDYDSVGNINTIADSLSGPQTQTFTYDALDRLVTAGASGDSAQGGYATETYGYDGTTGNLASKAGINYTYDTTHKHAVTSLSNGNTYSYDANGNMTTRHVGSQTFNFAYDAENRLVSVSGSASASFVYDGDGARILSTMDGATTIFVGSHYEKVGTSITKYYMVGASRVAMRKDGTLTYLLADHLGSSSISTDASGNRTSELRYKPWGETRFSFGTMPTKYQFTGQYGYTDDPSTPQTEGFGLVYFNARWMDPQLGRFAQADTMIPEGQGTQAYDRFAYTSNNPLRYSDPTGHRNCEEDGYNCEGDDDEIVIPFDTDEIVENIPGTAEQWAAGAQILDEIALAYDTLLGIYVLTWTGIGLAGGLMFEGNPVTGLAGAAAGYIIGEGSVAISGALMPGNLIASAATTVGLIGDMKSGNTSIEGSLSVSSDSVSLITSGQVSSGALTSVALTAVGWAANIVTLSLPLQAGAVANDRGWFPSISIPVNFDLSYP